MSDILQSNELNVHDTLIHLVSEIKDKHVGILLSSGIDSASVLFALLECGKSVHVYSFTLEDRISRDFRVAKDLSDLYSLEFTPIYLSTDLNLLKSDILNMHTNYDCESTTSYECFWPYLHAIPIVSERVIATGMGADGHFVISKNATIHYKSNPTLFRQKYFSNPNRCQLPQRIKLANEQSKILFEPYLDERMVNYLFTTSWNDCNKPSQKMPIRRSFPYDFENMHMYNHINFQKGDSGISDLFDELVYSDWNLLNYKSSTGILNCVNRGEITEVKHDRRKRLI